MRKCYSEENTVIGAEIQVNFVETCNIFGLATQKKKGAWTSGYPQKDNCEEKENTCISPPTLSLSSEHTNIRPHPPSYLVILFTAVQLPLYPSSSTSSGIFSVQGCKNTLTTSLNTWQSLSFLFKIYKTCSMCLSSNLYLLPFFFLDLLLLELLFVVVAAGT